MEDYKMKSNRNAQIIDEEISKLDIEDSAKAQLYIQLNTAHCLRSIKEELQAKYQKRLDQAKILLSYLKQDRLTYK